jgi:hypothetical protein
MPTTYTRETHGRRDGNPCCMHCGLVARQHHSDQRCYTAAERRARLRFTQREGRSPEPDEGCAPPWFRWLVVGAGVGLTCLVIGVAYGLVVWWLMGR